MPPANSYVEPGQEAAEVHVPLHAKVCEQCWLVQLDHSIDPADIFTDYAYFSSYSSSWLEHARRYVDQSLARWGLGPDDLVVEVASNDGYLLQNFVAAGVPVLGVEPAANVAEVAVERGVPTEVAFFGESLAAALRDAHGPASLMIANNVLAHVPDLNDFIAGFAVALADQGVLTVEFPHLLNLIEQVQFDTIYHEHYSYLSLLAVEGAFARHGLRVFDVEDVPTHGGSLRLFACRTEAGHEAGPGLAQVRERERRAGLDELATYDGFPERVEHCRRTLLDFLARCRAEGATVVAYGAAAKGNTLLNHAGVTAEEVAFVVDRNPHKQGRLLPGSHLPIRAPSALDSVRPDYVVVLPWNLVDEIRGEMAHVEEWGCRFVTAVPEVRVLT
jgi:SAM-dependent methyltransferase